MSRINALVPSYYRNFVCKCGACRTVCCQGWRIALSMPEYFSLLGLECSAGLRERLDRAFCVYDRPENDRYAYISHGWDGRCRILGDDGYCMLQRECGESVLPEVCRFYPRCVRRGIDGSHNSAVFSAGCENTVELLASCGKLTFAEEKIVIPGDDIPAESGFALTGADEIEMFGYIRDVQKCSGGIGEKLALLAPKRGYAIAEGALEPETRAEDFEHIEKLIVCLARTSRNIEEYGGCAMEYFSAFADRSAEYRRSLAELRSALGDVYESTMENVLVNHIFYEQYPFIDELNRVEVYHALVMLFMLCDYVCTGYVEAKKKENGSMPDNVFELWVDSLSAVFRMAEHSDYYRTAARIQRALTPPTERGA